MIPIPAITRLALRSTLRSRRTAFTMFVTLTLGISVSVTIFTIVNAVLFRPLPFAHADRLLVLWEHTPSAGDVSVSYLDFLDWQKSALTIDAMAAVRIDRQPVRLRRGAEEVTTCLISHNLLPMLGVQPLIGTGFASADDQAGGGYRALLSWGLWQREFDGNANVVGRGITIDGQLFTIAGVMPRTFQIPLATEAEIWLPFGPSIVSKRLNDRGTHAGIDVLARAREGVTLAAVRGDMDRIAAVLASEYPGTNRDVTVLVEELRERVVAGIRPVLLILLAGAILVLLIACTNAATILLVRVTARQHDFSVKAAIGASPAIVVFEVLVDIAVLAGASAAAASLVAFAAVRALQRAAPDLPRIASASLDANVFLFALATVVITTLIAGVPPAVRVLRQPLTDVLKEARGDTASGWRLTRARGLLIGLQFAFTAALLIPAILLILSFIRVREADLGFSPGAVSSMAMPIPADLYDTDERRRWLIDELLRRTKEQGIPAAICSPMPLAGTTWTSAFTTQGWPRDSSTEAAEVELVAVSPRYFELMQIGLRAGRTFTDSDRHTGRRVAVIDELFAQSRWRGTSPIGKYLKLSADPADPRAWIEVIGVVRHVESQGLGTPARVQAYLPYWTNTPRRPFVLVPDQGSFSSRVMSIARQIDSQVPIASPRPLAEYQDTLLLSRRLAGWVLFLFAATAVVLAGFGLHGLVSYTIALRRREMGIRLSLGATPRQVWTVVASQLVRIATIGVLAGLAIAYAFAPQLAPVLFETSPHETEVYVAVAVLLLAFAVPIALVPARRTAKVDPQSLLKE